LKRPLDANSAPQWPRDVVLFIDRCLGRFDVPDALRQAGALVEVHHDHFSQDAKDQDWLPVVGANGWLVLTNDKKFRHNYVELVAMFKGDVKAFVLGGKDASGQKMGAIFVKALKQIFSLASRLDAPFIANVTSAGNVSLAYHGSELFAALQAGPRNETRRGPA